MVYYLHYQSLDELDPHQRRRLCLEASKYIILGYFLSRRFADGLLLRCVNDEEEQKMLHGTHRSSIYVIHIGGHFYAKATSFKIIINDYYWPSIFHNSYKFVRSCDKCQSSLGKNAFLPCPYNMFS
jgi:hypothetical protein